MVTNTNDFRRYSYQYDTSYMLSGFNQTRSSAAPKRKPAVEPEEERNFKVHSNTVLKSEEQIIREEKLSLKKTALLLVVATFIIAFVGITLNSFAVKNELTREISSVQVNISNAQSENISLQSQLDAMVSISMIDDYAVNTLHMTKMKSNQVQYIDVNQYKQNHMKKINNPSPAAMAKQLGNIK